MGCMSGKSSKRAAPDSAALAIRALQEDGELLEKNFKYEQKLRSVAFVAAEGFVAPLEAGVDVRCWRVGEQWAGVATAVMGRRARKWLSLLRGATAVYVIKEHRQRFRQLVEMCCGFPQMAVVRAVGVEVEVGAEVEVGEGGCAATPVRKRVAADAGGEGGADVLAKRCKTALRNYASRRPLRAKMEQRCMRSYLEQERLKREDSDDSVEGGAGAAGDT
jgi:hypothetical protein